MGLVAVVESYPYDAGRGGDAVYVDRLRAWLTGQGLDVVTLITDLSRGRTSPLIRLHSAAGARHGWQVRRALALGGGRFLSLQPALFRNALGRLRRTAPHQPDEIGVGETAWTVTRLRACRPDLVILAFGACALSRQLAGCRVPVVALRGFVSEVENRIDGAVRIDVARQRRLFAELADNATVAFNNRADLDACLRAVPGATGMVVGMSFPAQPPPPPAADPVVLFVGADTGANRDALVWFVEGCWPRIRAQVPDATFRVVGSVARMLEGVSWPGVSPAGFVEDLAAEYAAAQVVVAPLVSGSNGVKTKVAEALSFGRPLVTTPIGVDPVDPGQFGDAVAVAARPAAFAAHVVELLCDADERARRTAQSRAAFDAHFSEAVAYAALAPLVVPILARDAPSAARAPQAEMAA